jgi:hypothetical protein
MGQASGSCHSLDNGKVNYNRADVCHVLATLQQLIDRQLEESKRVSFAQQWYLKTCFC